MRRVFAFAIIVGTAAILLLAACTADEVPDGTIPGGIDPTPTLTEPPTSGTPAPTAPTPTPTATPTTAPPGGGSPSPTPAVTPSTPQGSGDACANLDPVIAESSFVFATNVEAGAPLESGTMVEGCSRTFESNVPWVVLDREGNEVGSGFTEGGGVDGAGAFEFLVDYDVSEAQLGYLVIGGDDPSGGEGFPPPEHKIPVVLQP